MSDDKAKLLQQHVMIDYTNYVGARQVRQIVPQPDGLAYGVTPWHLEPQWTITAYDVGKDAIRTFAVKDIHSWSPTNSASGRSMASFAKQLQASMERNARMSNRLRQLLDRINNNQPTYETYDASRDIEAILKDEDI